MNEERPPTQPEARKAPLVELVVHDPRAQGRSTTTLATLAGLVAALVFALAAGGASVAFLPWYRTPAVNDNQPCNCRAPVRDALERALTETLLIEAAAMVVAFLIVFVVVQVSRRRKNA